MNQKINLSQTSDLGKIAKCHKSAFPAALSSKLGGNFIKSMLSWYIDDERGVLFHIEEQDVVMGYVGGIIVKEPGKPGAATSITQHSFKQFMRSFIVRPYLILHPDNLRRVSFIGRNILLKIGLIGKNKSQVVTHLQEKFEPSLGLVVIAVSNEFQGKGLGSKLLKEFEHQALKKDLRKVILSVKISNQKAIAAYNRNGWKSDRKVDDYLIFKKYL